MAIEDNICNKLHYFNIFSNNNVYTSSYVESYNTNKDSVRYNFKENINHHISIIRKTDLEYEVVFYSNAKKKNEIGKIEIELEKSDFGFYKMGYFDSSYVNNLIFEKLKSDLDNNYRIITIKSYHKNMKFSTFRKYNYQTEKPVKVEIPKNLNLK